MVLSACDQKKAEIIRKAEEVCIAETRHLKAIYELKCLNVKSKYKTLKEQAYHELKQQELEELGEMKRVHEADLKPLKAKHEARLSATRKQYRIATPDPGVQASSTPEPPSSPTLMAVSVQQRVASSQKTDADNNDAAAIDEPFGDIQESGDETDTSIPAIAPQAATGMAESTPPFKKRKKRSTVLDSDNEESDFAQSKGQDEGDDTNDASFRGSPKRPSGKAQKASASDRRPGRGDAMFASAPNKKSRSSRGIPDKALATPNGTPSSSPRESGQAEGGDEDAGTYSGPASQASRRNQARPGRPEPGK